MNPKIMESFGRLVQDFEKYMDEMTPEEFARSLGVQVAAIVFSAGMLRGNVGRFVGAFFEELLNRMSSLGIHVVPASSLKEKMPLSGPN